MFIVGKFFGLRTIAAVEVPNEIEAVVVKELLEEYNLLTSSEIKSTTDVTCQQGLLLTLKRLIKNDRK